MVQILVVVAALLFLIQVIFLTSKNKLNDQQAFIWLIFAILGVLSAFILPWFNTLSLELGILYAPSLIIMFAFLVVLSFLVYHTTVISIQEKKMKTLIQEMSFLQKEIRELHESEQLK